MFPTKKHLTPIVARVESPTLQAHAADVSDSTKPMTTNPKHHKVSNTRGMFLFFVFCLSSTADGKNKA